MMELKIEANDDAAGMEEESIMRQTEIMRAAREIGKYTTNQGISCLGCGIEIPEERRSILIGCCYCVKCQSDVDKFVRRRSSAEMEYLFTPDNDDVEDDDSDKKPIEKVVVPLGNTMKSSEFNDLIEKIDKE